MEQVKSFKEEVELIAPALLESCPEELKLDLMIRINRVTLFDYESQDTEN